jgi:L,D-transpeptidase ErfK/SrfK
MTFSIRPWLFPAFVWAVTVAAPGAQVPGRSELAGGVRTHVVSKGDTLTSIGARFGIEVSVLRADNQLLPTGTLAAGQALRIDNRHVVPSQVEAGSVLINLPQRLLFYVAADRATALPVAVGRRSWPTPLGALSIVVKETDPTWDVPASIRAEARRAGRELPLSVPPGPNNPLGRFWLGLSRGGVGIHGTNAPSSIYHAVTHGCVRLHPDDIAWLYPRVQAGTPVRIIYEPVLLAVVDGEVFLEVHPDVYGRADEARRVARALAAGAGVSARVDWMLADEVLVARQGIASPVTIRPPAHIPSTPVDIPSISTASGS